MVTSVRRAALHTPFVRRLLAIAGGAAAVQAIMLASVWTWNFRNGDAIYYQGQAQLNTEGHWFANYYRYLQTYFFTPSHQPVYLPSASHPPLTTMLYTVADWCGLTTFRQHSIVLALLFVATTIILGVAVRKVASDRVALLAAGLFATCPYLFVNPSSDLAETVVLFVVAVLLWSIFWLMESPTWRRALVVGAVAALCALARSELALILVTVVAPSIWFCCRVPWRTRIVALAAAGLAFLAVSAPWLVRNQTTFVKSVWFSDQLGETLLQSNCPKVYSGYYAGWLWHSCLLEAAKPSLTAATVEVLPAPSIGSTPKPAASWSSGEATHVFAGVVTSEVGPILTIAPREFNASAKQWWVFNSSPPVVPFTTSSAAFSGGTAPLPIGTSVRIAAAEVTPPEESVASADDEKVALAFIKTHKVRAAEIAVLRVLRTWNLYDPNAQVMFDYQDGRPHVVSYLGLIEFYPLLALAVIGVVDRRRRRLVVLPFLGLIGTAVFAVLTTFANGRYRVESDLAMVVLAAGGIEAVIMWRARQSATVERSSM